MDPGPAAAVERRTTVLRDEAKHAYELVRVEFERSFDRATLRLEELFAAYDEYVRLILGRPAILVGDRHRDAGRDLVFTIEDRSGEPIELAFRVESFESADLGDGD